MVPTFSSTEYHIESMVELQEGDGFCLFLLLLFCNWKGERSDACCAVSSGNSESWQLEPNVKPYKISQPTRLKWTVDPTAGGVVASQFLPYHVGISAPTSKLYVCSPTERLKDQETVVHYYWKAAQRYEREYFIALFGIEIGFKLMHVIYNWLGSMSSSTSNPESYIFFSRAFLKRSECWLGKASLSFKQIPNPLIFEVKLNTWIIYCFSPLQVSATIHSRNPVALLPLLLITDMRSLLVNSQKGTLLQESQRTSRHLAKRRTQESNRFSWITRNFLRSIIIISAELQLCLLSSKRQQKHMQNHVAFLHNVLHARCWFLDYIFPFFLCCFLSFKTTRLLGQEQLRKERDLRSDDFCSSSSALASRGNNHSDGYYCSFIQSQHSSQQPGSSNGDVECALEYIKNTIPTCCHMLPFITNTAQSILWQGVWDDAFLNTFSPKERKIQIDKSQSC